MDSFYQQSDFQESSGRKKETEDANVESDESHNTTDDAIETILMAEEDALQKQKATQNLQLNFSQSQSSVNVLLRNAQNPMSSRTVTAQRISTIPISHTQTIGASVTAIPQNSINVRNMPPNAVNLLGVQNAVNITATNSQHQFSPLAASKVVLKGQPIQLVTQDVFNPGLKTTIVAKKPISAINFKPAQPTMFAATPKPQPTLQNNIQLSPVKGGGFKIPISPLKNFKNPMKLSFLPNSGVNTVKTVNLNTVSNQPSTLTAGTTNFQFQTVVNPQPNRVAVNVQPNPPQNLNLQPNLGNGKLQCVRLVPAASGQPNTVNQGIPIANIVQTQPSSSSHPVKANVVQQQPQVQTYAAPTLQKSLSQPPAKTQRLIMPAAPVVQNQQQQPVSGLSPGSVLQAGNVNYAMVPAKYVEQLKKQLNNQLMQQAFKSEQAVVSPVAETATAPAKLTNGKVRKPCNCTKSMCLKLYCECFSNGHFCDNCNCVNCHNNVEFDADRSKAIKSCLERNPSAFKPKIGRGGDASRTHQKGCNCKRSGCLKNYCECYEARISCTSKCKCIGCKNIEEDGGGNSEQPSLMNLADAAAVRCQQQAAARSRINSQMKDIRSGRSKNQTTLCSGEKLPCMFFTREVIEATCTCLLAQAEEAEKTDRSVQVAETMILEEFGRCLMQLIQAASKTKPTVQP